MSVEPASALTVQGPLQVYLLLLLTGGCRYSKASLTVRVTEITNIYKPSDEMLWLRQRAQVLLTLAAALGWL